MKVASHLLLINVQRVDREAPVILDTQLVVRAILPVGDPFLAIRSLASLLDSLYQLDAVKHKVFQVDAWIGTTGAGALIQGSNQGTFAC